MPDHDCGEMLMRGWDARREQWKMLTYPLWTDVIKVTDSTLQALLEKASTLEDSTCESLEKQPDLGLHHIEAPQLEIQALQEKHTEIDQYYQAILSFNKTINQNKKALLNIFMLNFKLLLPMASFEVELSASKVLGHQPKAGFAFCKGDNDSRLRTTLVGALGG
ncbi:hypothetical protein BDP27DRAFT_1367347 [Rhodocollybia butyracea]|uniref:Uncharacterized protein n=1 Tax=Rhodocollybia butyracea TaxID=206335 RepID=A0A9P5U237_9AGAR|nr:hypothetical protein BDP27DRAFT_1367347 [Rhodocollybia butyracea]